MAEPPRLVLSLSKGVRHYYSVMLRFKGLLKNPVLSSLRAETARREAGHRSAAISKLLLLRHLRSPRPAREARSRLAMTGLWVFQQARRRRTHVHSRPLSPDCNCHSLLVLITPWTPDGLGGDGTCRFRRMRQHGLVSQGVPTFDPPRDNANSDGPQAVILREGGGPMSTRDR